MASPIRVLHVLDHSLPLHSGYTFRTEAILREQRKLGWETFHVTSSKQGEVEALMERAEGLDFYRTPSSSGLERVPGLAELSIINHLARRIGELVDELKPDIIHAHSPVLNALAALRVARAKGIACVYEIRAFWEDAAVDHGTTSEGSLRYRATRALETYAIKRVDHVFTICEGLRRDIVARGVGEDKVTVIPNAVDIASFTQGGQADRALQGQLGLVGATVVGFIGSFYAYEGLDLLLEALPMILEAEPKVRVLLVGGGVEEERLRAQAVKLGIADKVIFSGRVPHEQVQAYYDLVDVLAYPRHAMRLTELVTPLKPLEAMAQGRLFVASNVGGHRELIKDGETGLLFQADSALALAAAVLQMLAKKDQWPALRAAGRKYVETERNWAVSVANYKPIFERLSGKTRAKN